MSPGGTRKRPARWVPNQHGAWAMLIVPFLVGVVERVRSGESVLFLIPLGVCWFAGYFAFFAVSGWLKAPAKRRAVWVRPIAVASALTFIAGLVTVVLTGPQLAWWIPAFAVFLIPALVLAKRRRERDWTGGALTVAAASVMTLVARYPSPGDLMAAPDRTAMLILTGGIFAYFFGTVLYVKTNIRERGSRPYLLASLVWHAASLLVFAVLAATGVAQWWWSTFFVATLVRAVLVPRRQPPLRPAPIGIIEGVFCAVLLGAAALG